MEADPDSEVVNVRDAKTAELARKIALIPTYVLLDESPTAHVKEEQIKLESTLQDLSLHQAWMDIECNGSEASKLFSENPLLPGLVLTERGEYYGAISRRRYTEQMSRRYAIELFSRRPIRIFYEFAKTDVLVLHGNISVVMAGQICLERSPELLYEPIVVLVNERDYCLLDVHDLLQAQAKIHELATQLLRQQTQAFVVQTEKMASLGQMVAEVSHDLKNPVHFICGNLEYLSGYTDDLMCLLDAYIAELPEPSEHLRRLRQKIDLDYLLQDLPKVINSIGVGAEQLRRLVGGLQTLSHVDRQVAGLVDLHECLDNSLTILTTRMKGKVIVQKQYGEIPRVTGYTGQLIQVFMNILSNAVDALLEKLAEEQPNLETRLKGCTPDSSWKPEIVVTTSVKALHDDEGLTRDRYVSISMADNGKGIPKEIQERIFETFFTTKAAGKGTGLGLPICHQIVTQNHQGKLLLRSPVYNTSEQCVCGTEFEILLPVGDAEFP